MWILQRHQWRWIIDCQVEHNHRDQLPKLAEFITRKQKACGKREIAARKVLTQYHLDEQMLWDEWQAQVADQMAPLTCKFLV